MERLTLMKTFFAIAAAMLLIGGMTGHLCASGKTGIWHEETHGAELSFEPYELGSNDGRIVLDGRITKDDGLGLPFSRQQRDGRKNRPLMGWVKDDGDHLYISLHVSASSRSNATSGRASVYIKQPGGILEFKGGTSGGFEAFEGKRKHRVFEFKIPLDDIRVHGGAVELAFTMGSKSRG